MDIGIHCHRFPIGEQGGVASPSPAGLGYTSVRTHDALVRWCDLNPARGVYNWARMDAIVAAHPGKSIVYTLYGTPAFALLRPAEAAQIDKYGSPGGAGAANQADVTTFFTALFTRYKGKLKAVEIWNEPMYNGLVTQGSYFWGIAVEMVSMGIGIKIARDAVDSGVELWSPGFMGGETLRAFLDAGVTVWTRDTVPVGMTIHGKDIIDAVCWHPYGCWLLNDNSNIITGWSGVAMVRNVMGGSGIPHKKIVITEYGIDADINGARLAAYNALTADQRRAYWYTMFCALDGAGVAGIYLYAWDQNLCGDMINDIPGLRNAINTKTATI